MQTLPAASNACLATCGPACCQQCLQQGAISAMSTLMFVPGVPGYTCRPCVCMYAWCGRGTGSRCCAQEACQVGPFPCHACALALLHWAGAGRAAGGAGGERVQGGGGLQRQGHLPVHAGPGLAPGPARRPARRVLDVRPGAGLCVLPMPDLVLGTVVPSTTSLLGGFWRLLLRILLHLRARSACSGCVNSVVMSAQLSYARGLCSRAY